MIPLRKKYGAREFFVYVTLCPAGVSPSADGEPYFCIDKSTHTTGGLNFNQIKDLGN